MNYKRRYSSFSNAEEQKYYQELTSKFLYLKRKKNNLTYKSNFQSNKLEKIDKILLEMSEIRKKLSMIDINRQIHFRKLHKKSIKGT